MSASLSQNLFASLYWQCQQRNPDGGNGYHSRLGPIILVPVRRIVVTLHCPLEVAQLRLNHLSHVLHVGCGPPEVALGRVPLDSQFETSHGVFGVVFPIDLECFDPVVCGIVRLVQPLLVDFGRGFEGQACFLVCCLRVSAGQRRGSCAQRPLTHPLQPVGVGGLDV